MWCDVMWCDAMRCDAMRCDVMWYDMIWYTMLWCDVTYYCLNILFAHRLSALLSLTLLIIMLLLLFSSGWRYREGITKMQESSHSFDHHNQQPLKPKRRTPTAPTTADQVLKDTRATAAVTAAGSKEIILWAPDSVKLPEIRHFKKSARTIRRPIKGPDLIYYTMLCYLSLSLHLTSHHTTRYSYLIFLIFWATIWVLTLIVFLFIICMHYVNRRCRRKHTREDRQSSRSFTGWRQVQLCMLCLVMPCLVMLCPALSCYAMPCYALSCFALLCPTLPCHTLPCFVLPYHSIMLYLTLLCPVLLLFLVVKLFDA